MLFSQPMGTMLQKAYENNSKIMLDEFFAKWEADVSPVISGELDKQSSEVISVYGLTAYYYDCFNSDPFAKYKLERYTNLLTDLNYYVANNSITYHVLDLENIDTTYEVYRAAWDASKKDSIINFRPNIKLASQERQIKTLYLTNDFYEYIREFFKTDEKDSELVKEDYEKRKTFLADHIIVLAKGNTYTPIIDRLKVLSDPILYEINFNRDLTQARINFSIGCSYYSAYFLKEDGSWKSFDCRLESTC